MWNIREKEKKGGEGGKKTSWKEKARQIWKKWTPQVTIIKENLRKIASFRRHILCCTVKTSLLYSLMDSPSKVRSLKMIILYFIRFSTQLAKPFIYGSAFTQNLWNRIYLIHQMTVNTNAKCIHLRNNYSDWVSRGNVRIQNIWMYCAW